MTARFDPYRVKLAVSTGSKGRRRFDAGRIKLLKNEWKALGLHIVPPAQADYIILPDGSDDKGQSGRFATPIHYSDFLELLSRTTRPTAHLSRAASRLPSQSSRKETDRNNTHEHRIVRHDLRHLERRLKELSDSPDRHRTSTRLPARLQPPELPQPSQPPRDAPQRYAFVSPTVDFAVVRRTVEKLQTLPNLQAFVTAAVQHSARLYPTLYTTKQHSLDELRRLVLVVLTFWQELRVNLEVIMAADLPDRIDLNALPLCDVPTQLELPYDLTSCWTHFFQVWSVDNALLLTREDLIANVADRKTAAQYFWTIETNLYINYASIQCAQRNLELQFIDWVQTTRERFRTTPRCQPNEKDRCNGQFCVFYDEKCHEKPILFVLQELVIAFCGSTALLPITAADYETVNRLHQVVLELYQKWYGRAPAGSPSQTGVCDQVATMVNIMLATIQEEMAVDSVQDLFWSDLPDLMTPETLLQDWNDPASTQTLRSTVFSDAYVRRVQEIGQSLLRL